MYLSITLSDVIFFSFPVTDVTLTTRSFTSFANVAFHFAAQWYDSSTNLLTRGVSSVEDCYRICWVSNDQRCRVFGSVQDNSNNSSA